MTGLVCEPASIKMISEMNPLFSLTRLPMEKLAKLDNKVSTTAISNLPKSSWEDHFQYLKR
jgi:hypothetical protein